MLNNIPYIAVLLTCFNRKEKTLDCLKNLFNQKQLESDFMLEVFLVDDGSTDGTSEDVKKYYPFVNVIQGTGSLFWNRGMHLAWLTAKEKKKFDYFLWLNDDTVLFNTAISELINCEHVKLNRALVCGAIRSFANETFTYGGRTRSGQEVIPNGEIQNCYTINGNCVLVSSLVCDEAGLLDPIYPHAIGDYEYGLRVLKHGFDVITTLRYVGYCERNSTLPKWCYPTVPLKERVKALYSPLGNSHPVYFFHFERKHYGLGRAIKHYLSIHLRVLIPTLWR